MSVVRGPGADRRGRNGRVYKVSRITKLPPQTGDQPADGTAVEYEERQEEERHGDRKMRTSEGDAAGAPDRPRRLIYLPVTR